MASGPAFLGKDKYINPEAFLALAREFDKYAAAEGMKPSDIHFSPKVILKYDVERKKKLGAEAFEKKRAILIKIKKRMPAAGSRMRMVVVLRLYKGWEETEFASDIEKALDAIDAHNAKATEVIANYKDAGRAKREELAAAFDENLEAFEEVLEKAGVKTSSIAIGTSMMGKTMILKLPNGGYVSIGKADREKFEKAKNAVPAEPAAPAKKAVGSKAARSSKSAPVKPARTSKTTPAPTRTVKKPAPAVKSLHPQ